MLQQLEQCAVRKPGKVTGVNCTGFRSEENVCEEAKGNETNPERVSDLEIWERKDYSQLEMNIKSKWWATSSNRWNKENLGCVQSTVS